MNQDAEMHDTEATYRVTGVAGRQPVSLEDFVGATTLTVEHQGHEDQLIGTGVKEQQSVHFYEKESGSAVATESVWTLTDEGDGTIAAEPPSPD